MNSKTEHQKCVKKNLLADVSLDADVGINIFFS